jgi:hypothetical protein
MPADVRLRTDKAISLLQTRLRDVRDFMTSPWYTIRNRCRCPAQTSRRCVHEFDRSRARPRDHETLVPQAVEAIRRLLMTEPAPTISGRRGRVAGRSAAGFALTEPAEAATVTVIAGKGLRRICGARELGSLNATVPRQPQTPATPASTTGDPKLTSPWPQSAPRPREPACCSTRPGCCRWRPLPGRRCRRRADRHGRSVRRAETPRSVPRLRGHQPRGGGRVDQAVHRPAPANLAGLVWRVRDPPGVRPRGMTASDAPFRAYRPTGHCAKRAAAS